MSNLTFIAQPDAGEPSVLGDFAAERFHQTVNDLPLPPE